MLILFLPRYLIAVLEITNLMKKITLLADVVMNLFCSLGRKPQLYKAIAGNKGLVFQYFKMMISKYFTLSSCFVFFNIGAVKLYFCG
jgi:hypothetical protein